MNKLKVELKENFPYKFMEVAGAEADDIIGVLAPIFVKEENVLIISSDNDFLQLQKYRYPYWVAADIAGYNEIYQYSPSQKKFITSTVPELDLKMKILKGDAGDGVPNILSDSECFVSGIREAPLTPKKLDLLMESDPNKYDIATFVRWCRNKMLIDLECIPKNIQEEIINIWKFITPAPRARIVDYMVEHRLNNLMECIEEFLTNKNIYEIFDEIEKAPNKDARKNIIGANLSPTLVKVFEYAYHPGYKWKIHRIPENYKVP